MGDSKEKNMLLCEQCKLGNLTKVQKLLSNPNVQAGAYRDYPLQNACEHGHIEVVKLLLSLPLSRGVLPSSNDNRALRLAAKNGHSDIVQLLLNLPLERGVDPSALDNEALIYASSYHRHDVVRILMESGRVDPGTQNNRAMRLACIHRDWNMVFILQSDPRTDYEDGLRFAGLETHGVLTVPRRNAEETDTPVVLDEDPINI